MDKRLTVSSPKELLLKAKNQEMAIIAALTDALESHKAYLEQLKSIVLDQNRKGNN